MNPDKDLLYWQQRQENDAFLQRIAWFQRHWLAGELKIQRERERLRQASYAEQQIAEFIRDQFGYQVYLTTPNCPFDLWIAHQDRAARVEVKLSTYHLTAWGRGRYQVDLRQSSQIDLLIWIARTAERDWHYVIPGEQLQGRRNLAIWSQPGRYGGQWSHYLEAWHYLPQVIANTHPRTWQFSLNFPSTPSLALRPVGCAPSASLLPTPSSEARP